MSTQYFSLPGSNIKGIPLLGSKKRRLQLALIEIGCTPKNKKVQVRKKRDIIGNIIREEYPRKLKPFIKTIVVHWCPHSNYHPETSPIHHINYSIRIKHVTEDMKSALKQSPDSVIKFVKEFDGPCDIKGGDQARLLEQLIDNAQVEELTSIVLNMDEEYSKYGILRGALAEFFALHTIERFQPSESNLFKNGTIAGFNNAYSEHGTEIDAILTHYGRKPLDTLLYTLDAQDYITVSRNR